MYKNQSTEKAGVRIYLSFSRKGYTLIDIRMFFFLGQSPLNFRK